MIKKILFPVDFTPTCAAMAGYVGRAASIFGAKVALLHVADLASHSGFEVLVRPAPEIAEDHRALAQERLKGFLQGEFPNVESERFLAFGEVADEIVRTAHAGEFDLIIMPTHAGRFRRMLLGSTTAKVLIDADCPVLTSEHADAIIPKPLESRKWLCAISLNDDSERVLRVAARAAEASGARLSVIHAIQIGSLGFSKELGRDEELDLLEAREARRRAEQFQRAAGSDAPFRITAGPSIKEALIEAADRSGADMLIVERRRQFDLAYQIVRDSPVTVLSI
ncbi:MAG TPA: universal stress protein [Verrucomicrobiae bacterium]|nr:universal stress protein [Verrucomicrobiae bacterium]